MYRPPRHYHPRGGAPAGGGGGAYPQPNNFPQNPSFNPQFYQHPPPPPQQQQAQLFFQNPNLLNPFLQIPSPIPLFQNPGYQNPVGHHPNISSNPPAQNPSLQNPKVTIERVEGAVAKAQRDLVTAGENVSAWKVSQAALVSLQVDSWSSLGFQIQDVPALRRLLVTEGKVNAFIHCFVGAQKITSLYDLEVAICKNEGIESFEELGLGPLSRHPLAQHYFLIPSDSVEILKISSEDIITSLQSFMIKHDRKMVSAEEFLDFFAKQKSVSSKGKLGVRIQSLGLHISYIREAKKAEKAILSKSLGNTKSNKEGQDLTGPPSSKHKGLEKQMLDKRFDSITGRVKLFSSLCNEFGGKHTRFDNDGHNDSEEKEEDDDDHMGSGSCQSTSQDKASSQNLSRCPYPSTNEEMIRLGLKSVTSEKVNSKKDKSMGIEGHFGKKRKRKRGQNNDATMKKFLRKDEVIKVGESVSLSASNMEKFVTTWKEACREHSAAEVLDLMINFYMASIAEKKKEKIRKIFSSYPGSGLLNVAVTSIKRGLLDSVYDTVQAFGDNGSAPVEILDIGPSVKEDLISNTDEVSNDHGYRVTVDEIIKSVTNFFSHDVLMSSDKELPSGKLFETFKKLRDCETWLATQFSVKDFSSLGHGNFFSFLERHACTLSNDLVTSVVGKLPEQSSVQVTMLDRQLGLLLSQAQNNLIDSCNISKSDISLLLKKQFPTISFHFVGNEQEKCNLNLLKRHNEHDNSSCVLYSVSLLGKRLTGDHLSYCEKLKQDGEHIYSRGNVTTKDAIECLLKVPMLSDLLTWSHWDILYAPSFGPLSNWLLNEVDAKGLLCVATMDGKYIRVDNSATADDFLEAMIQGSPFQVALKLLSLLSLYGGAGNVPISLLKCYAQRAFDVILKNSTDSVEQRTNSKILMHKNAGKEQFTLGKVTNVGVHSFVPQGSFDRISRAVINVGRFILDCLKYLPSEFKSFGSEILVSGLRYITKDAYSVILRECNQTDERFMLHDIGLSLGIMEWVEDFYEFSSTVATDLFTVSMTLHRNSLCTGSRGTLNLSRDISGNPISIDHNISDTVVVDASNLDENFKVHGGKFGENGAALPDGSSESQDFSDTVSENCEIAENRIIQDATAIVESIRREEFGLDPNLDYTETCMLKKQHARLGRALYCLSQELYSQDSHLLLELVQNADDNIYSEDVDPTLIFILQETGIIVLNNEQGFSAQNIRALCDIGNSTKKGSSAGYIGHKGIGFKSVFRVTDAPEIHSNGFHVKFDITEGQIGFVLPTVIPPCNIDRFRLQLSGESYSSDTNQWNTCIVLPFRSKSREGSGMASIISMFSDLHPSLLLFLHRLRSLKFLNMLNNTLVNMRREILGDGIVKVSHGQETMTWLVINKKLPANFIRSDVQSTEIAIAFTLEQCENDEYKPHLSQQPVFAFLPLRNYGLKFILQGDFVLPSSREEVDGDSAWNQWLLSEFPALFVSAEQSFCDLPCFQNYLGKAVTLYLSFVPLGGEVHGFFSPLPHMIICKLRTSNCLLLDGPDLKWVPPCRVLRGWNGQIRMLLSDSLIQKHLGLGYLSKDIELSDVLAKSLGVQEYGPKILIEVISSVCRSSDDMNSLGLDWLSSWLVVLHSSLSSHSSEYPFVDARLEYDLIDSLKKIPFIPLSDGSYTSLADGPIWLPYDASSNGIEGKHSAKDFPSLYANLRTVNPLLLSAAAKNRYSIEEVRKDNLVHMLFKIGVQQLSAHEIMKSHILVALSKATYSDEDRYLMIEYLAFILLHFQSDCGRCSSEKNDIMSELRKKPLLLTNHGFKCPTDEPVHFGKEYQNPVNIDKLVDNVDDKWLEVDVAYLKHSSTRSLSSGLTKWKGFLQELGVTNFVQVISINRSAVDIPFSSFKDMTPYGDINLATSVINDWESPELLNFLSTFSSKKCREKCIYLLEVLDKMWDDLYNAYSRCCITSETNEGKKTLKSSFVKVLNAFGWIASSVDQDLHKPEDMFYDCDEVRSILGNLAPYVVPQVTSKMLLKDFGFKTEVSLADALEILQFWKTSKVPFTSSIHQMSKFYTFISNELNRPDVRMNEEFTSSSFIFVPFFSTFRHNDIVSGIFLSPKELYWHDPTGCVDKIKELLCLRSSVTGNNPLPCKALATIYPGLFDFFANVCAVPKSPPFESYLQILLQLSSVALPSQAAHVVFRVFVKWADDVKSGLINPQKILNLKEHLQISENTVLPTSQDKWVSLHPSFGLICWPDDNELKQQFKHSDGISFLEFGDLSNEDQEILCGKVAPLMHDIGVPALSEVVYREAVFYGTDNNAEKAALINWVLPFAQRYVHKLYPDLYLNLKKLQFDKLNQLQVIVVEKLFYRNHLKGQGSMSKRRFECSCLLQGNILYATRSADPHSLFLEFSRLFFNGSTELHFANFLHMITTMAESGSTSEQTEFFIVNSQKVPLLPLEEPLWCLPSLMEPPKLENPQPAVTPANTIDQNTPTSQRRPGANPNWPPTGWKSAPDVSYAQANYHLTKPLNPPCTSSKAEPGNTSLDVPHTEDLPIPVEIDGKWIVGDGTTASATVANLEVNSNPEPDNQLDDAISNLNPEKERQFSRMPDEKQAQKTGRLGELVAYKFFVEKHGSGNVKWVNEEIETGLPYDLILGPEGSSREYIEVKATRYSSKDWFEISPREWQFAVEWGDSYSIAHVLLGAKKASIIVLKNPLRLCQQNALQLALWISRQLKDSQVPS